MDKPEAFVIYCNNLNVAFSNFDFTMNLSFVRHAGQGKDASKLDLGHVVMSPQHFKATVLALSENLRKFESLFGEINLNPNPEALNALEDQPEIVIEQGAEQES